eukprot:CAMPEP_0117577808 /NCGR_PEP_ID=MMETSP0784-20121206/63629_1 /TAXON_ID=39447 /ORGANISM="" /LENGTH=215 /DNA_ID=CAMNT_0005377353 /DNA_START=310 /DNA_END=953 /DNA_ORIENTATION=+
MSLPVGSTIGDVEEELARRWSLGLCFHLVGQDGQRFDNPSEAVPGNLALHCVSEDLTSLCPPAQRILEAAAPEALPESQDMLGRFRLGRCRELGSFPTPEWKEDPRMPDFVEYHDFKIGFYRVCELMLIDGNNKRARLVGVINDGDADCNTGLWGPIYLRPSLREVGAIRSSGDTESEWEIADGSWYTAPAAALPPCKSDLAGGPSAKTPLETHL